jgi:hypothetical protein
MTKQKACDGTSFALSEQEESRAPLPVSRYEGGSPQLTSEDGVGASSHSPVSPLNHFDQRG